MTDKHGKPCLRYFVTAHVDQDISDPVVNDLERFAGDIQTLTGISTTFTPDSSPDGLHVLCINNVDYYFETYTGKYDGGVPISAEIPSEFRTVPRIRRGAKRIAAYDESLKICLRIQY